MFQKSYKVQDWPAGHAVVPHTLNLDQCENIADSLFAAMQAGGDVPPGIVLLTIRLEVEVASVQPNPTKEGLQDATRNQNRQTGSVNAGPGRHVPGDDR